MRSFANIAGPLPGSTPQIWLPDFVAINADLFIVSLAMFTLAHLAREVRVAVRELDHFR